MNRMYFNKHSHTWLIGHTSGYANGWLQMGSGYNKICDRDISSSPAAYPKTYVRMWLRIDDPTAPYLALDNFYPIANGKRDGESSIVVGRGGSAFEFLSDLVAPGSSLKVDSSSEILGVGMGSIVKLGPHQVIIRVDITLVVVAMPV